MNRAEFMRQLEVLLSGISAGEREEALQYYRDYFDDAGQENEGDVVKALVSPAKVAETIKAGLSDKPQEDFEFTETGFKSGKNHNNEVVLAKEEQNEQRNFYGEQGAYGSSYQNYGEFEKGREPYPGKNGVKKDNTVKIILIVVLAVLFSPVWLSVAGGILSVLAGVLIAVVAVFLALVICTVVFLVVGVGLFIMSFVKLIVAPMAALIVMGAGLLITGLGFLFLLLCVWICRKAIPASAGAIVKVCRMPFEKRGGLFA